jgi:hypothetical protein
MNIKLVVSEAGVAISVHLKAFIVYSSWVGGVEGHRLGDSDATTLARIFPGCD